MIEGYGTFATGHVWLGIDPGVTTGVAVLDDDGNLVGHANLHHETVKEDLDELVRMVHRSYRTIDVVQERLARVGTGKLASVLARVEHDIHEVVIDIYELPKHEVTPGEWKPSRAAKAYRPGLPSELSTHEKDAACMARYVVEKGLRGVSPKARRRGRPRLEDTPQRIKQREKDAKRRAKRREEKLYAE